MDDVDWMEHGSCRGGSVEVWFPEQPDFREARAICRRCPVKAECLDYAMKRPEIFGVWGGTSPAERAEMKRARLREP